MKTGNTLKILSLALAAGMIFSACGSKEEIKTVATTAEGQEAIDETITVFALGDNLLHMPVVNSGKKEDGTYEYSHLFSKIQPAIKNADMAVIGQESVFGGEELGYSGYPLFNSPSDMGKTLLKEGFDVVLHASNHVLDKMTAGVENTLEFWEDYPHMTVLGINKDKESQREVEIKEIKGAKIALLNYTYGTNGIPLPESKSYLVDLIDEKAIETDCKYAEENADFTIAFMHWGTEYSIRPDKSQQALAKKMCEWGTDLIIGSHPHVIEPVDWIESDNGNKMLVYYSLGNYVSRQLEARNLLGGIANVKLKFDGKKVTIDDYEFLPIVTNYDTAYKNFAVYRLEDYSDKLAKGHGVARHDGAVSVERWENMVEEVFEGYDTHALKYN